MLHIHSISHRMSSIYLLKKEQHFEIAGCRDLTILTLLIIILTLQLDSTWGPLTQVGNQQKETQKTNILIVHI